MSGDDDAQLDLAEAELRADAWRRCDAAPASRSRASVGRPGTAAMPRFSIAAPHSRLLTSSISHAVRAPPRRRAPPPRHRRASSGSMSSVRWADSGFVVHLDLLGGVFRSSAASRRTPRPPARRHGARCRAPAPSAAARPCPAIAQPARIGPTPSAAMSRPGQDQHIRGDRRFRRMRACACGERTKAQCSAPGNREIVDEPAAAGEETQVLDAPDRCADHPSSSRSKSRRS